MNNGDPVAEEAKAENAEQQETVLSQEIKETVPVKQEEATPSGETPEERFKNSTNAQRRLVQKEWRKHLSDLRSNPRAILEETAKEAGYDLSKEENKSHIDLQVNFERKRTIAEEAIRKNASNKAINENLKAIGVDPNSDEGYLIGSSMWRKYRGPENPDVYLSDEVLQEMESLKEKLVGKKTTVNQVNDIVMKKAGASLPQKTSPKGTNAPSEDKRLEAEAQERGVSPEKHKIHLEKTKKLPSWAKRRT